MTRATAVFTITTLEDFQEGDFLLEAKFLAQVLQNLEHFATVHDHSGDAGDGATLTTGDDGLLFMAMPAVD